jgi:Fic/DOC family
LTGSYRWRLRNYQFEAIHPFADGSGRTGRILNVLILVEAGLLQLPVLYLSRYIIDTKMDYYRLLLGVTAESAWEEWVLYILTGIEQASRNTLEKVTAIRALQDDFSRRAACSLQGWGGFRVSVGSLRAALLPDRYRDGPLQRLPPHRDQLAQRAR